MRKQRLGQILGVLLLPYRDETFFDVNQDLIANLRYSFSKLKYRIELTTEELYHYTEMYEHSEKKVREFLREQMRENTYVVDDFRLLLDLFFPEEDIVEFYRSAAEEGNPGNVGIDYMYLRNIYRMAESLLTFRDGRVAIRTWNNGNGNDIFDYPNVFDKVEIWNLLSRMISPDLLIAAFYVIARHEEIWNLSGQSENIMLADLTLARVLQKGMADTHMHFNAGISFLHMWYVTMNPYRVYEELNGRYGYSVKRSDPSFQYVIYRIMWAEFLECQKGDFETYIEQTYPKHAHKIEELFCCILKGKDIVADRESLDTLFDLLGEWSHRYNSSEAFDFLGETVYTKYQKWNINSEVLFLLRSLWYFKENPTRVEYLHLFLQYVRCKNLYMSQIVQSNQIQGLDNFQMYYRMLRKREAGFGSFRKLYDCIFKSMLSNPYLEKMEIRLVPQLEEYVKIQPLNIEYVREEMCGQLAKQIYEVLSQYQKTVASLIHVVFEQTLEVKEVCDAFEYSEIEQICGGT